jgi:hypothetical protein
LNIVINASNYLKPAWARRQIELALPLLPPGTDVALQLGEKRLVEIGDACHRLVENAAGVQAFPLVLEGEPVGMLLLGTPAESEAASAQIAGSFWSPAKMLEAEHGRRSVARETLESYREMACCNAPSPISTTLSSPLRWLPPCSRNLTDARMWRITAHVLIPPPKALRAGTCFGENASRSSPELKAAVYLPRSHLVKPVTSSTTCRPRRCGRGGARLQALLWLPLASHGEQLGVLVWPPAVPKDLAADLKRAQTLSSVAATALRNAQLYVAVQNMFQSFVRVIATAIDAKSPYTAGHCRRVPEIALMIAETAHRMDDGAFADFVLDENEHNALEIAAMLHDCGKVVTPEWVVDKATKLDAIVNRIELVALRFELMRRDVLVERDRALAAAREWTGGAGGPGAPEAPGRHFSFLEKCNLGGEFILPNMSRASVKVLLLAGAASMETLFRC